MRSSNKGVFMVIFLIFLIAMPVVMIQVRKGIMRGKIPNMEMYLKDQGYTNISEKSLNGFTQTVYFTATKDSVVKEVKVQFTGNGAFQIQY